MTNLDKYCSISTHTTFCSGDKDVSSIVSNYKSRFPEGACSVDDFCSCVSFDVHPDLGNGICIYINGYLDENGCVTSEGFSQLLRDMLVSAPEAFNVTMGNVWNW